MVPPLKPRLPTVQENMGMPNTQAPFHEPEKVEKNATKPEDIPPESESQEHA